MKEKNFLWLILVSIIACELEINSRFTTSYVGLQKVSNINIAKAIIDLIDKKVAIGDIGEIEYSDKVSFCKDENGILDIKIGK